MTSTKPHPDPGPRALRNPGPDPGPEAQYPQPGLSCPSVPETRRPPPGAPWAGQTVGSRKGSAVSAKQHVSGDTALGKEKDGNHKTKSWTLLSNSQPPPAQTV